MLLSVGQRIKGNKGSVSCQSSCESQLIQASVVFYFQVRVLIGFNFGTLTFRFNLTALPGCHHSVLLVGGGLLGF